MQTMQRSTSECNYASREQALAAARRRERLTGQRYYVARTAQPTAGWIVTERMPLLGEWYDSQGYRHG